MKFYYTIELASIFQVREYSIEQPQTVVSMRKKDDRNHMYLYYEMI